MEELLATDNPRDWEVIGSREDATHWVAVVAVMWLWRLPEAHYCGHNCGWTDKTDSRGSFKTYVVSCSS
ncbi:hypothetical protein RIF29_24239 [Crotalaria pallida]|uniref:Uncharacterized protein n=1 Tax=Crotalaria pallida TaxID=3830 RepID=A0AAN9EJZ6_CROPI